MQMKSMLGAQNRFLQLHECAGFCHKGNLLGQGTSMGSTKAALAVKPGTIHSSVFLLQS